MAGVGSELPALSVARTLNVCEPLAKPLYVFGDVQAAVTPPSNWHWNDAIPDESVPLKLKAAVALLVNDGGYAVIIVSGGVRSTVQVKLAGERSVFVA